MVDRTTAATQPEASKVINFWAMRTIFTDGSDNGLITARVEDHAWWKPPVRRLCEEPRTGGFRPHHLRCRPVHASRRRGPPRRDPDPLSPAYRYPLARLRHHHPRDPDLCLVGRRPHLPVVGCRQRRTEEHLPHPRPGGHQG